MSADDLDIEAIMAEIKSEAPTSSASAAQGQLPDPPSSRALAVPAALRRTLDEVRDATDLYSTHGMPPTRLWIPAPLRWFLLRSFRYVLNWQVHWNLTSARAFEQTLDFVGETDRSLRRRLDAIDAKLGKIEARQAGSHVVIAGPDPASCESLVRLLEQNGFEVFERSDPVILCRKRAE